MLTECLQADRKQSHAPLTQPPELPCVSTCDCTCLHELDVPRNGVASHNFRLCLVTLLYSLIGCVSVSRSLTVGCRHSMKFINIYNMSRLDMAWCLMVSQQLRLYHASPVLNKRERNFVCQREFWTNNLIRAMEERERARESSAPIIVIKKASAWCIIS